jgi:phosphohistidine phosphatase
MKEIILMRHAKSDWATTGCSDFDRPLNTRGIKTAPMMAKELLKHNMLPQLILSSSAKRAEHTTLLILKTLLTPIETVFLDLLYSATLKDIFKLIQTTDNEINRVMIVAHNPTLEDLSGKLVRDNSGYLEMPTATLIRLEADIEKWGELKFHTCKLLNYIKPKYLEI